MPTKATIIHKHMLTQMPEGSYDFVIGFRFNCNDKVEDGTWSYYSSRSRDSLERIEFFAGMKAANEMYFRLMEAFEREHSALIVPGTRVKFVETDADDVPTGFRAFATVLKSSPAVTIRFDNGETRHSVMPCELWTVGQGIYSVEEA